MTNRVPFSDLKTFKNRSLAGRYQSAQHPLESRQFLDSLRVEADNRPFNQQ